MIKKMYIDFHVKYRYSCQILIKLTFSTDFRKYSNTKFYKNPSSGSWVVPYGRTDGKIRRI
jgi:hypothetical protein